MLWEHKGRHFSRLPDTAAMGNTVPLAPTFGAYSGRSLRTPGSRELLPYRRRTPKNSALAGRWLDWRQLVLTRGDWAKDGGEDTLPSTGCSSIASMPIGGLLCTKITLIVDGSNSARAASEVTQLNDWNLKHFRRWQVDLRKRPPIPAAKDNTSSLNHKSFTL